MENLYCAANSNPLLQTNTMRFFYSLIFLLLVTPDLLAKDSTTTVVFQNHISEALNLNGQQDIWIDKNQNLRPNSLLEKERTLFSNQSSFAEMDMATVAWLRLRIINSRPAGQQFYISFCSRMDTVLAYLEENEQMVLIGETGRTFSAADKPVFSAANHLLLTLQKGETKTYYFKLRTSQPTLLSHFREMHARSPLTLFTALSEKYSVQSLYTGVMLMFFALSLFTFLNFKEKLFLYFGLIHLSFNFYFLTQAGITDIFLPTLPNYIFYVDGAVALIVIFVSLFVNSYIGLSRTYPVYFKIYITSAFFAAFGRLIFANTFLDLEAATHGQNIALLAWLVLTFIPVVLLAKKGMSVAKNLLAALLTLFFTSLIYVLSLLGMLPDSILARYAFQLGTVLFSFLLFYGLFQRIQSIRLEKQKMENLALLKSRFFANISHEFRTPLTLLLGPIERVRRHTEDPADKNLLMLAEKNGRRLLDLVNQLLDLNKLENGRTPLKATEVNFTELLKGIVMSFESYSEQQNIKLQFVSQKEVIPLWLDRKKAEVIFYNLLHNAFKFTKAGGFVSVMIVEHLDLVEVMIKDDGIGIAQEEIPLIFDRFFQVDGIEQSSVPGSGIGLALVRELVLLHSGNISVQSEEGHSTIFTLQLKKGTSHLKAQEMIKTPTVPSSPKSVKADEDFSPTPSKPNEETTPSKTAPTLLIIDDNTDVRAFIRFQLKNHFQIKEATNGLEGIELALEHQPDLVISDVMMPGKNGFEVCDTLKKDERTSHIPIILLTARAGQTEKVKGLEYGADDYLTKPFDSQELEVRIRKLIEFRTHLREKIKTDPTLTFKNLTGSPVDTKFMERVNGIIKNNLEDPLFGVGQLAEEVGLSKAHLNRKLNALTDISANKHIQQTRLKKALELLETRVYNVSEVGSLTGFNSDAYFVKCFREFYGKTPGSLLLSN
ncbi:response regulator [Owenweeksia hongkongensis]|uniref:response regulator n=1 Tax=Owenweeksia hongkongensis TaxID=253245 RepID=UPI003A931CE1